MKFSPEEIIFASSNLCNLSCAHCFLSGSGTACDGELSSDAARAFLRSCADAGRSDLLVGFSGGEPFLRADFLCGVSQYAADAGFLFSRVMTNGVFGASGPERKTKLEALRDAGFDGKLALSFDAFHGQTPEEAAFFLRAAMDVLADSSAAEIWSVISDAGDEAFYAAFLRTAELLCADIEPFPDTSADFARPGRFVLRGRDFFIPVFRSRRSFGAESMKWNSASWFADDFCGGPGHCLFIHPDGSAAPCCGFANYRDALKIGNIREGYAALMKRAARSRTVRLCYETGLGALREKLEKGGAVFPGKTDDLCAFCDYLCATGMLPCD